MQALRSRPALAVGVVLAGAALAAVVLRAAVAGPSAASVADDDVDFVAADVAHTARLRERVRARLDAVLKEEVVLRGIAAEREWTNAEQMRWRGLSEECTRMLLELDGVVVTHPEARAARKELIADVLKVAEDLKV